MGGAGQGSSLVGVLESCADSHDCGCVGVVGGKGLLENYASGEVGVFVGERESCRFRAVVL